MSQGTLLMALVPGPDYWESEPVLVRHFGRGSVSLELDDGQELVFDRAQLLDALQATDTLPVETFAAALASRRRPRR